MERKETKENETVRRNRNKQVIILRLWFFLIKSKVPTKCSRAKRNAEWCAMQSDDEMQNDAKRNASDVSLYKLCTFVRAMLVYISMLVCTSNASLYIYDRLYEQCSFVYRWSFGRGMLVLYMIVWTSNARAKVVLPKVHKKSYINTQELPTKIILTSILHLITEPIVTKIFSLFQY